MRQADLPHFTLVLEQQQFQADGVSRIVRVDKASDVPNALHDLGFERPLPESIYVIGGDDWAISDLVSCRAILCSDTSRDLEHYKKTPQGYVRISEPLTERPYLLLLRQLLEQGHPRPDRTGIGTRSLFGTQLRFNLRGNCMPLLTTKKMFWKGVVEELLWMISGNTDANALAARGVHIWDGNGSRAFLDRQGLVDYPPGQLGPIYGFQWRHWGAKYCGAQADYTGQGFDQLAECVRLIRQEPGSRRILMSAWNVADLQQMALPTCHVLCQFYVTPQKELSCQLYQRSADMGLGVPFNVASYALLTHMMAHVCGLTAAELVHTMGDCHIYNNHVEALKGQLARHPFPLPRLALLGAEHVTSMDDFKAEHLSLVGYQCHAAIPLTMAL